MFGNLYEIGPQVVAPTLELSPWRGAWNRIFGLLFIDQPIGTGFSISGDSHAWADDTLPLVLMLDQHRKCLGLTDFNPHESGNGNKMLSVVNGCNGVHTKTQQVRVEAVSGDGQELIESWGWSSGAAWEAPCYQSNGAIWLDHIWVLTALPEDRHPSGFLPQCCKSNCIPNPAESRLQVASTVNSREQAG